MNLIKVDVVGLQAAQRVFDRAGQPTPRPTPAVRVVPHRERSLGGKDDIVSPPLQCLANDLFRFALAVGIGGINEVDAEIQCLVDHADAFIVISIGDFPEHHRAQAVGADLDAGTAKLTILHGALLV